MRETKTVRIRATVEYDIEVPVEFTKESIEFHRNEGTFCADNMIEELQENAGTNWDDETITKHRICLCGAARFEVLDAPEMTKIRG